jgi:hypothetical protein
MMSLTVKQPYAAMILHGDKTEEVRTWRTSYRGPLLITASAKPADAWIRHEDGTVETLPSGCMICVVDLQDIVLSKTGKLLWILANPRPVEHKPVRGQVKLFDTTDGAIIYR